MVEACKDIPFAAGDAYRSFPQFWDAKTLIDEGEIGPIRTINLYQATNEISGGGCQGLCVKGLFAGDGDIDWVTGWVVEDPATDADQGMGGYVRYANGIEAFSHCQSAAKKGIEIICTHGVFLQRLLHLQALEERRRKRTHAAGPARRRRGSLPRVEDR